MKNNKKWFVPLIILQLLLVSMACNMPAFRFNNLPTTTPIPSQELESLENNIDEALEQLTINGNLKISFTEIQLSSLLANELDNYTESEINNINVLLRDGKVLVTSNIIQYGLALPAEVSFLVHPDISGKISIEVIDAKVGMFPFPDEITNELSEIISKTLDEEINSQLGNLYIESIDVNDGSMTIEGYLK